MLNLKSPSRISNTACSTRPEPIALQEAMPATNVQSNVTQSANRADGRSLQAQSLHERAPISTLPSTTEFSAATSAHALPNISVAFDDDMDDQPARTIQGVPRTSSVSGHEHRPPSSATNTAQNGCTGPSSNTRRTDNGPAPGPVLPLSTSRSPQEVRMEAARLMQNAARLMQEAARLNAEAARLTASVANA